MFSLAIRTGLLSQNKDLRKNKPSLMRFRNSICSIYTTFPFFSFFSLHQLRVLFVFYSSFIHSFIHWFFFFFSKPKTARPLAEEEASSHDTHHSESATNSRKLEHSKFFYRLNAFLCASHRTQHQQVQQRRRRSHDI